MKNIMSWALVVIYACMIFALSSYPKLPQSEVATRIGISDKVAHFVEYGCFSLVLFFALDLSRSQMIRYNAAYLSVLITILCGVLNEIYQIFVPGRRCSGIDIFADGLGAIMFQIGRYLITIFRNRR